MRKLTHLLQKIRKLKRSQHHHLLHQVHTKHKISRRTLFYIKEYSSEQKVISTVLKESIKILILASLISSLGGLALENIKQAFISIIPLVILLPALNDMIGSYGSIFSAKFSTLLHEGRLNRNWQHNPELKKLFLQVLVIASITTFITTSIALGISWFTKHQLSLGFILKIFLISFLDVLFFISLLVLIAIFAGFYVYRKKEDPNNFLIPITTSIADLGNMLVLAGLVLLFF